MEGAKGVDDGQLNEAIKYGICKVNIATDTRLIRARVHREFFANYPDKFDPIIPGNIYIEEQKKFLIKKFELLGAIDKVKEYHQEQTI